MCPLSERGCRRPLLFGVLDLLVLLDQAKSTEKSEIDSYFLWESSVPSIRRLLRGAGLPPFDTKRWRQKCPQGTSVGIGRRCSLSGHKRLRCCDAKDCTASTVAARQSPQAASALACCPSFSRPLRALEPPSDLIPPPVQCGGCCALHATMVYSDVILLYSIQQASGLPDRTAKIADEATVIGKQGTATFYKR